MSAGMSVKDPVPEVCNGRIMVSWFSLSASQTMSETQYVRML